MILLTSFPNLNFSKQGWGITVPSFFFFFFIYFILIFFWLCWVFVAVRGLSLVVASGGHSSLRCPGFTAVASLVVEHGLQACRLQELWPAGSRAQVQQLWRTGPVAPRHVGSSWTRARTRVPCIGRQTPNRCTTREALQYLLIQKEPGHLMLMDLPIHTILQSSLLGGGELLLSSMKGRDQSHPSLQGHGWPPPTLL